MTTPPAVVRDGSRAWVDTPLDGPYAMRLRRLGAHWDSDVKRWWVGIAKAAALEDRLSRPLSEDTYTSGFTPPKSQRTAAHPQLNHAASRLRLLHRILDEVAAEVRVPWPGR